MKEEKQKFTEARNLEVEKIFVSNFQNAGVLFMKPENQNPMALIHPKNFLSVRLFELQS